MTNDRIIVFFFQAEDGIRDLTVTGVQTCALPISENAILESNSLLKFLRPDLYITVLDPATADFKKSAQEFLDRADAVIVHEAAQIVWQGISLKPVAGRLVFYIHPPESGTSELTQFVKSKLSYFPPMGIGNFANFG